MQEVTPLQDELMGQILGGAYEIEARLDEGGMGMVYQARHIRLGRKLAVKVMSGHLTQQPGALERFTREAEIISQLSHPHVVQVLDFNTTDDGRPYLVMELLEGRALDALLSQHGQLQLSAALEIASQAARALSVAHQAGIVHRDLKPANVFLIDAGEKLFVKLLDFGISKRTQDRTPGARKLTGEFDILGTPDYMAPEQAIGRTSQVDHRGDQYALATILYEMLAGQVPFKADEILELLQKVVRDPPPPPSQFRSDVPPEVEAAIVRALSKDPEARFASILDFAEILEIARDEARLNSPELGRASMQHYSRGLGSLAPTSAPPRPERPAQAHLSGSPVADRPVSGGPVSDGAPVPEAPPPPGISSPLGRSLPPERSRSSQPAPARTSWHARNPVESAKELIQRARQELGLDNLPVAVSCAESALDIARTTENEQAKKLIAQESKLLERIFSRSLSSAGSRIEVSAQAYSSVELSPEEAFLLSRIDTGMTVEEAVDLSPLPRDRTLGGLVGLVAAGQIKLS